MTCNAILRDQAQGLDFSFLVDRTHAGASLDNGNLELILHRRVENNDWKGPIVKIRIQKLNISIIFFVILFFSFRNWIIG